MTPPSALRPPPSANGPPASPLDRVLRLCERLSDHELYWLRLHGIPGIQRDRKGVKVTLPKGGEDNGHAAE